MTRRESAADLLAAAAGHEEMLAWFIAERARVASRASALDACIVSLDSLVDIEKREAAEAARREAMASVPPPPEGPGQ